MNHKKNLIINLKNANKGKLILLTYMSRLESFFVYIYKKNEQ